MMNKGIAALPMGTVIEMIVADENLALERLTGLF